MPASERNPALQELKSRLGGYVLRGNHEAAERTRRSLAYVRTEVAIRRAVEQAPPLDAEQVDQLRALLPEVVQS